MHDCIDGLELHPLVNFYAIEISSVLRTSSYEPLYGVFSSEHHISYSFLPAY